MSKLPKVISSLKPTTTSISNHRGKLLGMLMAAGTQPVMSEDRNGITPRLLLKTVLLIKDSFWV